MSSKKTTSTKSKLNKIDRLLLKIDYIENTVKNIPKRANQGIENFISKNKYILYSFAGLILATILYKSYTSISNYASQTSKSTTKITNTIDSIYKIIDADDLTLNETQQLFKYFYLYLTKTPFNKDYSDKFNQLYSKKIRENTDTIYENLLPTIENKLIPLTIASSSKIIDNAKQSVIPVLPTVKSLSTSIGNFIYGSIASRYTNKNILNACYTKINNKVYSDKAEFMENFDLEAELTRTPELKECYDMVSSQIEKYSDSDKAKDCIPVAYNNLLHFLVYNYKNNSVFDACYNSKKNSNDTYNYDKIDFNF